MKTNPSITHLLCKLGPDFFKALCDPTRANILLSLANAGEPVTVGSIAEQSTVDLSVVSRHLAVLKRAGLVDTHKQGREVFYFIKVRDTVCSLRALADAFEKCCSATSESKAPSRQK